jgi:hypothetical protein
LPFAIQIEHALDADQNVIGWTESHGRTPCDTTAFALDHAPHGCQIEFDGGHGFHRIRGACRRRDRTRRCLGYRQAAGRSDRDDNRRGAISGQTTDRVLIDNHPAAPRYVLARVNHRARKPADFLIVEGSSRAGGDEGGEVNAGIAAARDVGDDLPQ